MPVISLRIGKGRSVKTKRTAAQSITEAATVSLGVKRESVTILFEEYDRENWASGGELHIDKFEPRQSVSTKVLVLGSFRLPPEALDMARAAMREMIMASRAEEGCVEYAYSDDIAEPGLIHVNEIWESRDALRRHFESEHLKKWRSAWKRLQISDRSLCLYEIGEPEPI